MTVLSLSFFSLITLLAGVAIWVYCSKFPQLSRKPVLIESGLFFLTGLVLVFANLGLGFQSGTKTSNFGSVQEENLIPVALLLFWVTVFLWRVLFAEGEENKPRTSVLSLVQIGALCVIGTTDFFLLSIFAFDLFCWSLISKLKVEDTGKGRMQIITKALFASNLHCTQLIGSVFLWLGGILFSISFQAISIGDISSVQIEKDPTAFVFAQIGFVLLFAGVVSHLQMLPINWTSVLNIRKLNFSTMLKSRSLSLAGGFLFTLQFFVETNHGMSTLFQTMAMIVGFLTLVSSIVFLPSQRELKTLFFTLFGMHAGLLIILFGLAAWESQNPSRCIIANADWPGAASTAFWLLISMLVATTGVAAGSCGLKILNQYEIYPEEFSGWIRNDFLSAWCWLVCLATLVGMPLTIGFWSRASLLLIALSTQTFNSITSLYRFHEGYWMLALFLVMAMTPFVIIFFRYAGYILFEPSRKVLSTKQSPMSQSILLLSAVVCLGVGCLPGPMMGWLAEQNQHAVISSSDELLDSQESPDFGTDE